MGKNSNPGQLGKGFLEKFQPFSTEICVNSRGSRNVSARSGKTGDNPGFYKIVRVGGDNRDRVGRLLGTNNCRHTYRHNDIHAKADQLGCELGYSVQLTLRPSVLDG